ncbi:MAG: (2Fe-2S) ferredoxin domain-containing protein [Anaeromyxobacteraceae bacterium]|nr:(2Fe-2S) ferredoxin domain-containing protein [Anaeromyxobacteraceae bacterium]
MRFTHHVFICENKRPDGDQRGSCCARGSEAVRQAFKDELARRGLKGQVRANAAGCLDACALGPAVVVYPEGVWYGGVKAEDVPEIVERHLQGGVPVERLRLRELEAGPRPAAARPPARPPVS